MNGLRIIEATGLDDLVKAQLLNLWNNEYPRNLCYNDMAEFDEYLNNLDRLAHLLLVDHKDEINGWAFSFDREGERWFAVILSEKQHGKGLGKAMIERLKMREKELNGWVTDHNSYKKLNLDCESSHVGDTF